MITMLGSPRRCCDGLTRRETLKAGALSMLGGAFNLPNLFALECLPSGSRVVSSDSWSLRVGSNAIRRMVCVPW